MKWICKENRHKLVEWHKWFAWYPVCVHKEPSGDKTYMWLTNVQRSCSWLYEDKYTNYRKV